jgi:hypothetical protein
MFSIISIFIKIVFVKKENKWKNVYFRYVDYNQNILMRETNN